MAARPLTFLIAIYFSDISSQAGKTKEKNEQVGLHQTKKFLHREETIDENTPTKWENIFTNDTSDKGLISKIYKEHIKLITKNQTNK